MPARRLTVAAVLALAAVVGCSPAAPAPPSSPLLPTARYDAGTGWTDLPAVPPAAPAERWRMPLGDGAAWTTDAAGTALVVARGDGAGTTAVTRVDPTTGAALWRATVPGAGAGRVTLTGGRTPTAVVATTSPGRSDVTLLDLASGRVQRTVPTGPFGRSVLVTDDVVVVAGADRPRVTAGIDRATGVTRWTYPSELVVAGQTLLSDERDGRVAVDPATGRPRWRVPTTYSDPVAVDDLLVVTGSEKEGGPAALIGLDPVTGRPRWTTPEPLGTVGSLEAAAARFLGLGLSVAPLAGGGLAVVVPAARGTASVDQRTGALRWRTPRVAATRSVRVGGAGYVLALPNADPATSGPNRLDVLDARSGSVVGSLDDLLRETPTDIAGGAVYLRDVDGSGKEVLSARVLPDLRTLWTAPIRGARQIAGVPGGVVVALSSGGGYDPTDLVGYVR